jgi:hypothetical protein
MSDWSRDASRRFVDQRKAKESQDAKVLHDQEMLRLKAPQLWDQLAEEFSRKCTEFNAQPEVGHVLPFDRADANTLTIGRTDTHAKLTATFLPLYAVTINGIKAPGQFKIDLIAGTSEVGFFHDKFGLMNSDEISMAALDMLLSS